MVTRTVFVETDHLLRHFKYNISGSAAQEGHIEICRSIERLGHSLRTLVQLPACLYDLSQLIFCNYIWSMMYIYNSTSLRTGNVSCLARTMKLFCNYGEFHSICCNLNLFARQGCSSNENVYFKSRIDR